MYETTSCYVSQKHEINFQVVSSKMWINKLQGHIKLNQRGKKKRNKNTSYLVKAQKQEKSKTMQNNIIIQITKCLILHTTRSRYTKPR